MLRLHKLFFFHLLVLLSILFIVLSILSYYGIKSIEINNYRDRLKHEIVLLETLLKRFDESKLKNLDSKLHSRVTIIDKKGKVLFESRYDKERMENHLLRPEVQEALHKGWGTALRYSTTLHQELLYVAKRSNDKIIRLAYPLARIKSHFLGLWLEFLALFAVFVLVALGISYLFSKRLKREVDGIVEYVKRLAHKEYEATFTPKFAKEFEIIASHLKLLAKKLKKREEKKKKFTKKIKEVSKQRNELISAVSHEFKNPVAIIHGYSQSLLSDKDMPEAIKERFTQKIYQASQKLNAMIDRLSMALKFESGSFTLQKSRFDLCELTKEAVLFLEQKHKNREIFLDCEPAEIEADKALMETVVLNLLDNALKYSELSVEVRIKDGYFCVTDKGIGIKPEHIEKITKKFYRVGNSWDNSMGLGLFIVSYILERHGVELQIESRFGGGSRFCFLYRPLQTRENK